MVGLLDFMTRQQVDDETNEILPAYGSFNDEAMIKSQPKDCIKNIYVIKAKGTTNSSIHSNCYSWIYGGKVTFLIKEQEAKNKLMATKKGQKMSVEQRAKRLLPHEMTTKLFDEIGNLRLKTGGNNLEVVLEQINTRFGKDKFSSFEYGLWRIKELEDEYNQSRRKKRGARQLMFFTSGRQ